MRCGCREFPGESRRHRAYAGDIMRGQSFVLALLAGTLISGQSLARDASGTTVGVKPDAKAAGAGGLRIIEIKGPIYMGDVITTDRRGQVQIIFVDDTKFVVGANSKVTIDASCSTRTRPRRMYRSAR